MLKLFIYGLISMSLLSVDMVKLEGVEDIIKVTSLKVKPVVYNINMVDLENNVVQIKKENFINLMLPSILLAKEEIKNLKEEVEGLVNRKNIGEKDKDRLEYIYEKYKVEVGNSKELLKRLNTIPIDIALAQAIIESGWGTSRFSREGNNIYGIWSFRETEDRMEASHGVRNGKKVYLRKYEYIYECVLDYFYSLAVGANYESLREKMLANSDSLLLIEELEGYSEIRGEYVKRLKSVITFNKLDKFNSYMLQE